ncbi:YdeI/OmpD-associated family protein [Nocardiopsis rhodophaea]|uniref:YdeI/OmpD-associated family protein n=1 Tax=Nocardiopsis rhodophaea TaxID=280238 RepID=A0ABP5ESY6_9ACTN
MTTADITFAAQDGWEEWLEKNHDAQSGVWLRIAKKDSGVRTVSYGEALDAALCFGWIDGQRKSLDATYWSIRFTPRRANSRWSKVNRGKAEALIAQGRMREPGLREVELAKSDGRWDAAYESQKSMRVPADLQAALDENPAAKEFFAELDSKNRYAILYRIQDAKKPETRARRLQKYLDMLNRREKIY